VGGQQVRRRADGEARHGSVDEHRPRPPRHRPRPPRRRRPACSGSAGSAETKRESMVSNISIKTYVLCLSNSENSEMPLEHNGKEIKVVQKRGANLEIVCTHKTRNQ
jgi:hypothetical protein